jgi:hypothetical protein
MNPKFVAIIEIRYQLKNISLFNFSLQLSFFLTDSAKEKGSDRKFFSVISISQNLAYDFLNIQF